MSRILIVRDAIKARVNATWTERADHANDEVLTPWAFRLDAGSMTGRKVLIFPAAFAGVPGTRGGDQDDYTYTVVVAERYARAGDPPDAWIDERVGWCEMLLEVLGNPRLTRLLAADGDPTSGLWPEVAGMPTVYDTEELTERKLFLSVLSLTYRELAE